MSNTSLSWADQFAHWTIRHAAHRAPPPLAERLEEEWLADLEARPEPWSRVLMGIGCCWAALVIVQEQLGPGLTAASTTGNKVMSSYGQTVGSLIPRRTTALAIIIGLHVALIFAFASGLGPRVLAQLPDPMQLTPVQDPVKTPPELPPPPKIDFVRPTEKIIPVEQVDFDLPPDPSTIHEVIPESTQVAPTLPPPQPVHRVLGNAGKGFPNSSDYYPPSAIRMNETGTVIVQVCVNSKGYLTGIPTLTTSSHSPRLDEGALKLARAGSGRYRPTTENGQAVDSCFPLDVTFNLKD
jgi:protein TonB